MQPSVVFLIWWVVWYWVPIAVNALLLSVALRLRLAVQLLLSFTNPRVAMLMDAYQVENSVQFTPQQLAESRPDVVVFALCGYSLEASIKMAREAMQKLGEAAATAAVGGGAADALRRARVVVTDGMHVFSRPGPWLAESLEVLVEALHGEAQVYGHEGKLWVDLGIGAAGAGSGAGGSKAGPGLVAGTL